MAKYKVDHNGAIRGSKSDKMYRFKRGDVIEEKQEGDLKGLSGAEKVEDKKPYHTAKMDSGSKK